MKSHFEFDGLYVLDMANNHQGSLDHGLRIIREVGEVVRANGVRAALKFQFRNFETFIHPAHRQRSTNKHIPRFLANALTKAAYVELAGAVRKAGMITMSTPFDEESVELIEELDLSIIKIASCSANDWPLLEKAAAHNRPVIVSTAGLTLNEIDDVVSFLNHRRVHFAMMHCVAIYPTPPQDLQLSQIASLRRRHPDVVIGFSTHEDPTDIDPVTAAIAKGAQMLERHVGVPTENIQLNAYSSTPEQLNRWFKAAAKARLMCGQAERRPAPEVERLSLMSLKRGVYARKPLKAGVTIERSDVYFAMPPEDGQLCSGEWKEGIKLTRDLGKDAALLAANLELPLAPENAILIQAIHEVKSMLNEARIALPTDFTLEFSHHYGKDKFRETGATLIDCINREYCKKLIIQLPHQHHPSHYHKRKEETFQILSGELEIEIDGRQRHLYSGDTLVVPQGVWHSFGTKTGVIFEEISTTHFNDDSFYEDKNINQLKRSERKTKVRQWGRYQF